MTIFFSAIPLLRLISRVHVGARRIMAKKRTGDTEQRVLHVELVMGLVGVLGVLRRPVGFHRWNKYSPRWIDRVASGCGERLCPRLCFGLVVVTDSYRRVRIRRAEKRSEHALQTADQKVGFSAALGEFFDLRILGADLASQKLDLPSRRPT